MRQLARHHHRAADDPPELTGVDIRPPGCPWLSFGYVWLQPSDTAVAGNLRIEAHLKAAQQGMDRVAVRAERHRAIWQYGYARHTDRRQDHRLGWFGRAVKRLSPGLAQRLRPTALAAAALFADATQGRRTLGVFRLATSLWWIVVVDEGGVITVDGDVVYTDATLARARAMTELDGVKFDQLYLDPDLDLPPQTPGLEGADRERSLRNLIGRGRGSRVEPVDPHPQTQQRRLWLGALAMVVVLLFGYDRLARHPKPAAFVQPTVIPTLPAPPGSATAALPSAVIGACSAAFTALLFEPAGWRFTSASCEPGRGTLDGAAAVRLDRQGAADPAATDRLQAEIRAHLATLGFDPGRLRGPELDPNAARFAVVEINLPVLPARTPQTLLTQSRLRERLLALEVRGALTVEFQTSGQIGAQPTMPGVGTATTVTPDWARFSAVITLAIPLADVVDQFDIPGVELSRLVVRRHQSKLYVEGYYVLDSTLAAAG